MIYVYLFRKKFRDESRLVMAHKPFQLVWPFLVSVYKPPKLAGLSLNILIG